VVCGPGNAGVNVIPLVEDLSQIPSNVLPCSCFWM